MLILKNDLTQSDRWSELLSYLEEEPLIGENVYVFRTENLTELMDWNKEQTLIGEYLPGLLENRIPDQEKNGTTLRQVYHQWYENGTLPGIPEDHPTEWRNSGISGNKFAEKRPYSRQKTILFS